SITGQWRVRAYTASDSLNSTAPDRTITFRRTGLLALNQDFLDAAFPPPFWGLDNGGGTTQYWTRNTVGAYQTGVGSAKYDFWTASAATPIQTLTSNQFPPVTLSNNYLRFNYSHAYYLSGTTLANDSCRIETSTNNGSTWTVLLRMGASQSISSGYNSSPIMSTLASQSIFTPTSVNQWATKILSMPEGTNKVRFVTKSNFGNNLYIDNITSGLITGLGGNILSITPDKYELSQNYPNPFNPTTKINFSIPKQGLVTLRIYDVLGKEVMTLINEQKAIGNYEVVFTTDNLSSGAYFYKLEAAEFSAIKRMVLIK
ncbi:MAG: T9SS type A sorting domain-containing protein, partial [bacterium]